MMKLFFIISLLFSLTSCFQQSNSSTSDVNLTRDVDLDASPEFVEVFKIVQAKCAGCHSHSFDSLSKEKDWLSARSDGSPLIVKSSPDESNFFIRMRTCSTASNADMPELPAEPLTDSECDSVKEWINSL